MAVIEFRPQPRIEVVRVRRAGRPAWMFDAIERDRLGRSYRRTVATIFDDTSAIDHAGDLRRQGFDVRWGCRP